MMNSSKYRRLYSMPPVSSVKWACKNHIEAPPIWCSVDLRDGNQALVIPMNLSEKLEFFKMLVKIGFKEIEVGFPAASETEFQFLRTLISEDLIPDDVTIQVITQARESVIRRTFDSLRGCKTKVIIHMYSPVSTVQQKQVFYKSDEEMLAIATEGAVLLKKLNDEEETGYFFEYSPESFTESEIKFSLSVCNAVLDIWKPGPGREVIIDLPSTVSRSLPHVFASQVEYIGNHLDHREHVILSVHPHNDRGTGIADAELALLAGAERVEGTLFGNGERTGNTDLMTLALNLYSHGIDPGLSFSHLPELTKTYERLTRMKVEDRHPYAGKLVFAAFSGSHQDAIAKGMSWRNDHPGEPWTVPYLTVDPADLGRQYEGDVIRINSQSGKGGIGYILSNRYGFHLPPELCKDLGSAVKSISDQNHKELLPGEILSIFETRYIRVFSPIELVKIHFIQTPSGISTEITLKKNGGPKVYHGEGNGRLDAVSNSIKRHFNFDFSIHTYEEHALKHGSDSEACAYVCIELPDHTRIWGVGIHNDIIDASVRALFSAVNRYLCEDFLK